MKSILFATRDETGETDGWVRVANGSRHASIQEHAVQLGLDAAKAANVPPARRTAIAEWVNRASTSWPLPKGEYPLVGRSAVVIEDDTIESRERFRTNAQYRSATRRPTRHTEPARATGSVSKAQAAQSVAKARQALLR
jgi:hypothetical protein